MGQRSFRDPGKFRCAGAPAASLFPAHAAAIVASILATLIGMPASAAAAASPSQRASYKPGLVLVELKPGVAAARLRAEQRHVGIARLRRLAVPSGSTRAPRALRRVGELFAARVTPGREAWVIRLLRREPAIVRFAEFDYVMRASGLPGVPNDPSFGLQWGSSNLGQKVRGIRGVRGADDRAAAAWAVTTGRRSVVIGEVDTGVDYLHPDLSANIWTNPGGVGGCLAGTHGYNVVAASCDPADDDSVYGGHGTHVAGIMGAIGNNHIGVSGMNWSTTILPVKWLDANASGSTDQLIGALDWLLKAKQAGVNIRVINDSATFVGTAYSQALSDEIDLVGANGILFVTAAGNTGQNDDDPAFRRYPCGYDRPTELCVTASAQNDRLPSWANWGPQTVDLAAPGANIYSTLRNGTYGYIDGGSMAAAQVSGAAALILSKARLSAIGLRADILKHVDVLRSLAGRVRTGGRLDVCGAISACARGCRVPRLIGHRLAQARIALRRARCTLGRVRKHYSSRAKSGLVLSQSPTAGGAAPIGTAIGVVISRGERPGR